MFDSSKLDAYLTGLCQARDLPGVSAAIMGPDGLEYAFNYGFRDGAFTRPVDNDTLFGVASMSKSMTALCACILACEGRLDLDAPVSDFFPEFELAGQPREAATVRTLAMHTAGIPPMEPLEWSIAMNSEGRSESDWLREMKRTAPNKMETIDQIIAYIAHCGYNTLGAPGEVMSYSNEGYAILSYIVDQAAGVPLEQFMQVRIFDPLGMTRTILDNGVKAARALSGGNITSLFEVEDGRRTCDDCWSVLPPFRGCAMVKSTSRDMAAYYRMIANMGMHEGKQAIPAHAVDLLVGRYHPLSHLMTMCMGLNKREFAGHVVCEHAGGLHGVSSKGALLLGEGYGFAVLCNQGDEDMDALLALEPEYIVEAASVESVRAMAIPALKRGVNLVILSIGAFADLDFYAQVKAAAVEGGAKVHLASGAIGGFDVLQTVTLMAQAQGLPETAGIETHTGAKGFRNTPVWAEHLLTDTEKTTVFTGNAKQAIATFPRRVNVAVATSLATTGPEITGVTMHSVPGWVGDDHCITAEIEGVKAVVDICSSTSAIAGWSAVSLLRNLASPVCFY